MYVVLALIVPVAIGFGLYRLLFWTLEETVEESARVESARDRAGFYNPQVWAVFSRIFPERPPLLGYRRDKRGRFRKMR